jgi:uncharacterized RDD family membrane protein YckC
LRFTRVVSEREPAVLRDDEAGADAPHAPTSAVEPEPAPAPVPALKPETGKRVGQTVWVVGFWKRLLAAMIDLAIVVPVALIVTLVVGKIAGVRLPPGNIHVLDIDLWIDLVLATDPAIVMAIVLGIAIGLAYLLVFHVVWGRTPGMRLLKMKVIDVYGDTPSPARSVARTAAYLASAATLLLGFLWIGFDSEKRGLHDWIAGTYVVRA